MPPKFTFDRTPKHYKVVMLAAPGMDYTQIETDQAALEKRLKKEGIIALSVMTSHTLRNPLSIG